MSQATPPTWSRVKSILADALDLDPDRRGAFLDAACAGQPALRKRLDDLIAAASRTSLTEADSPARALEAPDPPHDPGARLGRYRIVRLIGRGGMGAVYEAVDEQLGRPVAVKVLQSALASRTMLKRFEAEPRLLARLRHPSIAQIFEAGSAPGRHGEPMPFFAMELVADPAPITDFAHTRALSTDARLRLFLRVCDAVAHGHASGVIHRDLKPANILVDPSGQPKVIDFGVARATDPGASAATLTGELLGTLRYMSPEQVGSGGDADDVDARADVYALGVVLYELLAGAAPEPDPPGGVVASIRQAQHRSPRPLSRLDPRLSGDIETVALKAVEPDRNFRYQSVAEFAADLQRILRSEPISARPHSAVYQLRMFARRHRALVGGAAAVFLALSLGITGTSIGLVRARHAQQAAVAQGRRAQRIAAFLENTVRSAQPNVPPESWIASLPAWGSAGPADVGVAGVLRHAAAHLGAEFADDPSLHAEMALLFAGTLNQLEDRDTAVQLAQTALDLQNRAAADQETIIRTRFLLSKFLTSQGRLAQAERELRSVLDAATAAFGPLDDRALDITADLVIVLHRLGRSDEALALAHRSIQAVAAASGADSGAAWRRHLVLVELLVQRSGSGAAERDTLISECHKTIDGLSRTLGPSTAPVARACWCLANVLQADPATIAEAEALQRRALPIDIAVYGPDTGGVYEGRSALITILIRQRKLAEAEPIAREALESSLRMIGPRSMYTLKAKGRLARILIWLERNPDEAETLAREAAQGTERLESPVEDYAAYHHAMWAAALRLRHYPERAEEMLRDRIHLRGTRTPRPGGAWVEAYQYLQLALCLSDLHRPAESADAIRTARAWADLLQDPTHPILLNVEDVQERLDPATQHAPN